MSSEKSFESEWAEIRAQVAQGKDAGTRLNGTGAGAGKDGKKLRVTAGVLTARAGHADTVRSNFAKADNEAMRETGEVKAGLMGFTCGAGFDALEKRWRGQMSYLQDLLSNGVAKALRAAATDFQAEDEAQAGRFSIKETG